MKKISLIILFISSVFVFNSCEEEGIVDNNLNFVTFASENYTAIVELGGGATVDVSVLTANSVNSDRSFNIIVNESSTASIGSYTVPNSVTVPAGTKEGMFTISLSDVDLGIGVNELILNFSEQEGLFNGGGTTIAYTQQCNEITASLNITFDNWASETGYTITDALGGIVASKPIETWSNGLASVTEDIVLCAGRDYTLTIIDDFGDGLSDPSDGSYTLTIGSDVKASGGGNFGSEESTQFDTN